MTDTTVLDSWEDAGDNDAQLELRHRELLKRKKEEEQLARSKQMTAASAMNQAASSSTDANDLTSKCPVAEPTQPVVRILRRPQSSGQLSEQEQSTNRTAQAQSRPKTLEERQAAYAQARERIFGEKYEPDVDEGKDPSTLDDRPRVIANPTSTPYGRPPTEGMGRVSSSPATVARPQNQMS
uniref:SUZ domain-containing protein n=1 Tax=Plectus sambesii TaxID=2011161 RepID=A0A914VUV8_9BILA